MLKGGACYSKLDMHSIYIASKVLKIGQKFEYVLATRLRNANKVPVELILGERISFFLPFNGSAFFCFQDNLNRFISLR